MAGLRLHKYLAECGVASRRRAEELIAAAKVKVNGQVVTKLGTVIDPSTDRVQVAGREVSRSVKGIVLFYKPVGVVSTRSDPEGRRTVAECLGARYHSYFPVGRLDIDSEGLLVLTNDGELAQRLLHPSYEIPRTYRVQVRGRMPQNLAAKLARGIELDDGPLRGRLRIYDYQDDVTLVEVTLAVGRNRIVRRLMDHWGFSVKRLIRIAHGPFELGGLRSGQLRELSADQYRQLRQGVMRRRPRILKNSGQKPVAKPKPRC